MAYRTTLFRMSGFCIQFPTSMPYSCIHGVHCIPCCDQWLWTTAILHPCEEWSNFGTSLSWEHFTISEFVQVRMFTVSVVECRNGRDNNKNIVFSILSRKRHDPTMIHAMLPHNCRLTLNSQLRVTWLWDPSTAYSIGGWHVLLHKHSGSQDAIHYLCTRETM